MITTIKKQFLITWRDWLVMSAVLLGGAVIGKILFGIVAYFDKETVSYFPLATIITCAIAVMYGGIQMVVQFPLCFNIEVGMGCTRKHYFCAFYLMGFAGNLVSWALILVVNRIEDGMNRVLYPNWGSEIELFPYLLKWGMPILLLTTIVGCLFGALYMKYGKVAFWIMWALWMIGCIGGPQISEAVEEAPDSVYGRIGSAIGGVLGAIPVNAWICAGVLVSVLSLIWAWALVRRQQVTS